MENSNPIYTVIFINEDKNSDPPDVVFEEFESINEINLALEEIIPLSLPESQVITDFADGTQDQEFYTECYSQKCMKL